MIIVFVGDSVDMSLIQCMFEWLCACNSFQWLCAGNVTIFFPYCKWHPLSSKFLLILVRGKLLTVCTEQPKSGQLDGLTDRLFARLESHGIKRANFWVVGLFWTMKTWVPSLNTVPQRSRHETEVQLIRFSMRLREKTIDDVCPSDLTRHTNPTCNERAAARGLAPRWENEEQTIFTNTASSW